MTIYAYIHARIQAYANVRICACVYVRVHNGEVLLFAHTSRVAAQPSMSRAFAEAQVDDVNGWSQQNSEQYVCLNFVAVDLRPSQT